MLLVSRGARSTGDSSVKLVMNEFTGVSSARGAFPCNWCVFNALKIIDVYELFFHIYTQLHIKRQQCKHTSKIQIYIDVIR